MGIYTIRGRRFTPALPYTLNARMPLTAEHVFQNNETISDVATLFTNDNPTPGTAINNYLPGFPAQLINTVQHTITVLFPKEWDAMPKKIRIYGGAADFSGGQATKFYLTRRDTGVEVEIGSYLGGYQTWVELDISVPFVADKLTVRGFKDNGAGAYYGARWQVIGDYRSVADGTYTRATHPLSYMNGVNTYVYDFMTNPNTGNSTAAYPAKMNRLVEMGITMPRFYVLTREVQPSTPNVFAFQPSLGGWFFDELLRLCKQDYGMEPLLLLQHNLDYNVATFPSGEQVAAEDYGLFNNANKNLREVPATYADAAHMAFVVTGRYGRNASVDPALMGTYFDHASIGQGWRAGGPNVMKRGLNYLNYLEIGNELDKTWNGVYGYNDGYKLAAMLSAIYDGHQGTLGAGYGIKNADPTMKLVISGLAFASPNAVKAIWDWSKKNRGLKPDGTVDLPYDVINYHHYSNNAFGQGQTGNITCGVPPETSGVLDMATTFVKHANKLAPGKEVWNTEWGWDYHAQSTYNAPAIGPYSAKEVVGIWAMRSMLLHPSTGIDRMLWFRLFDAELNDPQFFETMSLLQHADPGYTKRPIGDYLTQLMGSYKDYVFDGILSTSPYVVRYKRPSDNKIFYAIWAVETATPATINKYVPNLGGYTNVSAYNFTQNTGNYNLSLPTNPQIVVKNFVTGSNNFSTSTVQVGGGAYTVSYGMKPVIIEITTAP